MNLDLRGGRAGNVSGSLSTIRSDLIAVAVTIASIGVFVATGAMALPKAIAAIAGAGGGADRTLVVTLLLNIALILFAWRRCHDLKKEVMARAVAEEQAHSLAYQDCTTGLHNRRSLLRVLATRSGTATALLVIDLDHFKKVNDVHGHSAGDRLLAAVAECIVRSAPEHACCARLSGDEFAVALFGDDAEGGKVAEVAEAILSQLSRPFNLDDTLAHIGASIGASLVDPLQQLEASLQRSDIAMYEAKKRGRNCFAWFDASMEDELRRRNQLEAEMRVGIARGEFVPFYQPQIDLATGSLEGFEVLARWIHPERGIVEPSEFITVAEATGLITDLSLSIMRPAFAEASTWHGDLRLAINISPVQLKDPLLAQRITKLLVETGLSPQKLELEITESSLLSNLDLALATIESLKNLGILVSLDDFGTGYASLTQLQALPFDRIKIDRSFVLTMAENSESAAIVAAIAGLGASLKLPVTAEGIETESAEANLRLLGCTGGQGWLFGRPIPASELRQMLATLEPETFLPDSVPVEAAALAERRDHGRRGSRAAA